MKISHIISLIMLLLLTSNAFRIRATARQGEVETGEAAAPAEGAEEPTQPAQTEEETAPAAPNNEQAGGDEGEVQEAPAGEEQPAEPTEEPAAEPTEEPAAEPTEEPAEEPAEETVAEPVEETTAEPATPAEETPAEPAEEPVTETVEEPVIEIEPASTPIETEGEDDYEGYEPQAEDDDDEYIDIYSPSYIAGVQDGALYQNQWLIDAISSYVNDEGILSDHAYDHLMDEIEDQIEDLSDQHQDNPLVDDHSQDYQAGVLDSILSNYYTNWFNVANGIIDDGYLSADDGEELIEDGDRLINTDIDESLNGEFTDQAYCNIDNDSSIATVLSSSTN